MGKEFERTLLQRRYTCRRMRYIQVTEYESTGMNELLIRADELLLSGRSQTQKTAKRM